MTDASRRLVEVAFPLKQASLDSVHEKNVHEKNVRHGLVSTLRIWPARGAACVPDLGTPEARRRVPRAHGRAHRRYGQGKTVDGILHWGRENGHELDRFRAGAVLYL